MFALLAPGPLALAGCGAGALRLRLDRHEVMAGERVSVRLQNGSFRRVGYNLCGATLQRHTAAGWKPVRGDDGGVCLSILYLLGPGETSRPWSHALPGTLAPGRYRMTTRIEAPLGGTWRRAASLAFTVNRAARERLGGQPALRRHRFSAPAALKITRGAGGLDVTAAPGRRRQVEVDAPAGLVVGARHQLTLRRGDATHPLCGGLGGTLEIGAYQVPQRLLRGVPRPGTEVVLTLTIFQTDVPVGHMWSPGSGSRYKVLWTSTVRAALAP